MNSSYLSKADEEPRPHAAQEEQRAGKQKIEILCAELKEEGPEQHIQADSHQEQSIRTSHATPESPTSSRSRSIPSSFLNSSGSTTAPAFLEQAEAIGKEMLKTKFLQVYWDEKILVHRSTTPAYVQTAQDCFCSFSPAKLNSSAFCNGSWLRKPPNGNGKSDSQIRIGGQNIGKCASPI